MENSVFFRWKSISKAPEGLYTALLASTLNIAIEWILNILTVEQAMRAFDTYLGFNNDKLKCSNNPK